MLPTQIQVRPLMLTCAFTIYVQKKQSAQIDVTTQQLGEPRPAFNNGIQRKAVEPERVSRAASSTRTTKPARGVPAPPPSRTGKERKVAVKLSRFQTATA
uniref:Uncharacterized protein n=1 Tax=Zea mays TaxID=4577 RepID=A0A804N1W1_MAIZE